MPTITTLSGKTVAIDLETRDFEAYRDDVLSEGGLADAYLPEWVDRSELDLGVAMTEDFAFIGDNLSYYQDRCANECLWTSITQRRSIVEQSKHIGYSLRPPTSAQVSLTIITNDVGTLPIGQTVQVKDPEGIVNTSYELLDEFESTGPGTYTDVIAIHGVTVTDQLRSSEGKPDMKYELSSRNVSLDPSGDLSLAVFVTESGPEEAWNQVDNFQESEPADKVYRVEIDEDDIATVIFGDGINGKIPDSGVNNLRFVYRSGGGTLGNEAGPNTITQLVGNPSFVDSVTNPERPFGGLAKESIEEAKINAPRSLKALGRAVSHQDFATQAIKVPGIRDAFAYRGKGAYEEFLVVAAGGENPVPSGSWNPYTETGTGMLGAVGTYVSSRMVTPVILKVVACKVVDVMLSMRVFLFDYAIRSEVERLIADIITTELKTDNLKLGQQLPLSKVYKLIEDIPGVDYLDITRFQREPYSRQVKTGILVPSDVYATDFIVDVNTLDDVYTIKFESSTVFKVVSKNQGTLSNGTVGVPYVYTDGGITFTIVSGTVPPSAVDELEIVAGEFVGNIDPATDELSRLKDGDFTLDLQGGKGSK